MIPAILLARLALDRSLQGQRLGGALLAEALEIAVRGAANVGAAFVVVDALHDKAAKFYEHYDFIPCVPNPLRLVRKMSEIAAVVALPAEMFDPARLLQARVDSRARICVRPVTPGARRR